MQIAGAILLLVLLAGGGDRHRKFDLDELERYIAAYRDFTQCRHPAGTSRLGTGSAQAAAIEQLAAFTAKFPQIVAQLGLGKRK